MAVTCTIYCASSQGSSDGKPDDPEYQALRAQVSRTLEEFSHFLSTQAAVDLALNVDGVFEQQVRKLIQCVKGRAKLLS